MPPPVGGAATISGALGVGAGASSRQTAGLYGSTGQVVVSLKEVLGWILTGRVEEVIAGAGRGRGLAALIVVVPEAHDAAAGRRRRRGGLRDAAAVIRMVVPVVRAGPVGGALGVGHAARGEAAAL